MATRIQPLPIAKAAAREVLHDGERQAVVFAYVAHLNDVRVGELDQRADLAGEAACEPSVLQHGTPRHLDHHVAVEAKIARTVDEAHTAFAELVGDTVTAAG